MVIACVTVFHSVAIRHGVQNFHGRQCSFHMQDGERCMRYPVANGRFCIEHLDCARLCAIYRPDFEHTEGMDDDTSLYRLLCAYFPNGFDNPPVGHHCKNHAAGSSMACDDDICRLCLRHLVHGKQLQDEAYVPVATTDDKRERQLAFQKVNDLCWFRQHRNVGFFFFVCPCGAPQRHRVLNMCI